MSHRSLLAAAALLFVAMSPSTAWAHDWGGGAFIVAFNLMIAVPVGLTGLLVGWAGSGGVKTFVGVLQVLAIAACLVLWMFVIYFPLAHMVWGIDGMMNGVWNAPDTCSGMTFFAPSSLAC